MIAANTICVSISESAIQIATVDQLNGKYVCNREKLYAINNWASTAGVVKAWADSIIDFTDGHQSLSSLHIAMPGPFDYTEGISYIKENRHLKSLYGENIKILLAAALKLSPNQLMFYNDAVCCLAAEFANEKIENQTILGLYFDEGFGSALLQNGKIEDAELWNKPFLEGTAEDFFSVKWQRKNYFELTGLNIVHVNEINDFSSLTRKELFKVFIENLATYIQSLLQEKTIDTIVLGGVILDSQVKILAPLKKKLSAFNIDVNLVKSKIGHTGPMIGAGVLRDQTILEI